MLFRTIDGSIIEINKYDFKSDKLYYEKIMEIRSHMDKQMPLDRNVSLAKQVPLAKLSQLDKLLPFSKL